MHEKQIEHKESKGQVLLDEKARPIEAVRSHPPAPSEALARPPENKGFQSRIRTVVINNKHTPVLHAYGGTPDEERELMPFFPTTIIMPGFRPKDAYKLPFQRFILMPGVDLRIVNFLRSATHIYLVEQARLFSAEDISLAESLPPTTFNITSDTTLDEIQNLPEAISRICITRSAKPELIAALPPRSNYEISIVGDADHRLLTDSLLARAQSLTVIGSHSSPEAASFFDALAQKRPGFLQRQNFPIKDPFHGLAPNGVPISKRKQEAQYWQPSALDDHLYEHFTFSFNTGDPILAMQKLLAQHQDKPPSYLTPKQLEGLGVTSFPRGDRGLWAFIKAAVDQEGCGSVCEQASKLSYLFENTESAMMFLSGYRKLYPTCKTPAYSACSFGLPKNAPHLVLSTTRALAKEHMLEPGFRELLPDLGKAQEILQSWGISLTKETSLERLIAAVAFSCEVPNALSKAGLRLQKIYDPPFSKDIREDKEEASVSDAHVFFQEAEAAFSSTNYKKACFLFLKVSRDKTPEACNLRLFAQIRLAQMYKKGLWVRKSEDLSGHYHQQTEQQLSILEKAQTQHPGESQFFIALHFLNKGTKSKEAFSLLTQAADAGHIAAKLYLATSNEFDPGIKKNALPLYQELAGEPHNNASAQYYLGDFYMCEPEKNVAQALIYYEKAARSGHVEAQRNLGWLYSLDKGRIDKDKSQEWYEQQALFWLTRAAKQEDPWALCFLAEAHRFSLIGVTENLTMALALHKQAADRNHPFSLWLVATEYAAGVRVKKNEQTAFSLYQQIGEEHPICLTHLGRCYLHGIGVWKNPKKGIAYLKAAQQLYQKILASEITRAGSVVEAMAYVKLAKDHYRELLLELGTCYEQGNGVAQDILTACQWYEKAATESNSITAQVELGSLMLTQNKIEGDKGAFFWYEMAAKTGDAEALFLAAECYRNVADGGKVDAKKALSFHKRAAELYDDAAKKQHPGAQFVLAEHYCRLGKGGKPDLKQASILCKSAATAGHVDAIYTYAQYCRLGIGRVPSHESAKFYFQMAIERSHVDAKLALFLLSPDSFLQREIRYLHEIMHQGSISAKTVLGRCYLHGLYSQQKNEQTGIRLLQEAADENDPNAQYCLGRYYMQNSVTKAKAIDFLQRAAATGHNYACRALANIYNKGAPGQQKNVLKAIEYLEKFLFPVESPLSLTRPNETLEQRVAYQRTGNVTNIHLVSDVFEAVAKLPDNLRLSNVDPASYQRRYAALVLHHDPKQLALALGELYTYMEKIILAEGELSPYGYSELEAVLFQSHAPLALAHCLKQLLLPIEGRSNNKKALELICHSPPEHIDFLLAPIFYGLPESANPAERQNAIATWIEGYLPIWQDVDIDKIHQEYMAALEVRKKQNENKLLFKHGRIDAKQYRLEQEKLSRDLRTFHEETYRKIYKHMKEAADHQAPLTSQDITKIIKSALQDRISALKSSDPESVHNAELVAQSKINFGRARLHYGTDLNRDDQFKRFYEQQIFRDLEELRKTDPETANQAREALLLVLPEKILPDSLQAEKKARYSKKEYQLYPNTQLDLPPNLGGGKIHIYQALAYQYKGLHDEAILSSAYQLTGDALKKKIADNRFSFFQMLKFYVLEYPPLVQEKSKPPEGAVPEEKQELKAEDEKHLSKEDAKAAEEKTPQKEKEWISLPACPSSAFPYFSDWMANSTGHPLFKPHNSNDLITKRSEHLAYCATCFYLIEHYHSEKEQIPSSAPNTRKVVDDMLKDEKDLWLDMESLGEDFAQWLQNAVKFRYPAQKKIRTGTVKVIFSDRHLPLKYKSIFNTIKERHEKLRQQKAEGALAWWDQLSGESHWVLIDHEQHDTLIKLLNMLPVADISNELVRGWIHILDVLTPLSDSEGENKPMYVLSYMTCQSKDTHRLLTKTKVLQCLKTALESCHNLPLAKTLLTQLSGYCRAMFQEGKAKEQDQVDRLTKWLENWKPAPGMGISALPSDLPLRRGSPHSHPTHVIPTDLEEKFQPRLQEASAADPNSDALYQVIWSPEHYDKARRLIWNGVGLRFIDPEGRTALHAIVMRSDVKSVKSGSDKPTAQKIKKQSIKETRTLLDDLKQKEDVFVEIANVKDNAGKTALCCALERRPVVIPMAFSLIASKQIKIDDIDREGNGALYYAIRTAKISLVQAVIKKEGSRAERERAGPLLLKEACKIKSEENRKKILKLLFNSGVSVFTYLEKAFSDKYPKKAVKKEMSLFLEADSTIIDNNLDENGRTPLYCNKDGQTLLHVVAMHKNADLMELLLSTVSLKKDALNKVDRFTHSVEHYIRRHNPPWKEGIALLNKVNAEAASLAAPASQAALPQKVKEKQKGKRKPAAAAAVAPPPTKKPKNDGPKKKDKKPGNNKKRRLEAPQTAPADAPPPIPYLPTAAPELPQQQPLVPADLLMSAELTRIIMSQPLSAPLPIMPPSPSSPAQPSQQPSIAAQQTLPSARPPAPPPLPPQSGQSSSVKFFSPPKKRKPNPVSDVPQHSEQITPLQVQNKVDSKPA